MFATFLSSCIQYTQEGILEKGCRDKYMCVNKKYEKVKENGNLENMTELGQEDFVQGSVCTRAKASLTTGHSEN